MTENETVSRTTLPDGRIIEGHFIRRPYIQPMKIAELCYQAGVAWHDLRQLGTAVCVALAECNGGYTSYNDNFAADGSLFQRDCGLFQIGVRADGRTPAEMDADIEVQRLRNDSAYNVAAAYRLYDRRGWQPWASWLSAICYDDGYRARAQLGVANFLSTLLAQDAKTQAMKQPDEKRAVRLAHQTLPVPFIGLKSLRSLYPNLPLG